MCQGAQTLTLLKNRKSRFDTLFKALNQNMEPYLLTGKKILCGGMEIPCRLVFTCSSKAKINCLKELLESNIRR